MVPPKNFIQPKNNCSLENFVWQLGDCVFVKVSAPEEKTAGGIFLPDITYQMTITNGENDN